MWEKLDGMVKRFDELEGLLASPEIVTNPERLKKVAQEHSEVRKVVEAYRRYKKVESSLTDAKELSRGEDAELAELARDEIDGLSEDLARLEEELKELLIPTDPLDGKNIILEIRAGTGGEEAALFARDLFEMYRKYAESRKWKTEILSLSAAEAGGIKELIAMISGRAVYGRLRYESGVHRVQRVPATESQGRVHTSAATVAVLPEAEEVDVDIDETELNLETFRAGGPGGQHVNTTDSAVRITHKPTGLVVICQDERSQHKNRAKAMKILRARLLDLERERQNNERASIRKGMVGSGDRSERIRTYNFPQGRVTDHRANLTLYKLDSIMEGELDDLVEPLSQRHRAQQLAGDGAS